MTSLAEKCKGNQTKKFGQLIEYEKYFLEKSNTKWGGGTIPRPFLTSQN